MAQLEHVLAALLEEHEQLLSLLNQKRDAMRQAKHQHIADCCQQENEKVQAISELEKQRLICVGQLTQLLDPNASEPLRLMALAERLPEPARGRLLVQRAQLKHRMEHVQREAGILKRATDTLYKHMQGLVQTIGAVCSNAGTYGETGSPPRDALSVSTFSATA